jgi:UDP-glucuronate decarboxylase
MNGPHVGPLNLGNDSEITLLELVKVIEKMMGRSLRIEYQPLPQDDPCRRRPDLTRARTLLGYEPKVPLEEGVRETIEYFRKVLSR